MDKHAAIFAHGKFRQACADKLASPAGAEVMKKLVEIRNQEFICRERAAGFPTQDFLAGTTPGR
jgi:hypothetical protein